MKAAGIGSDHIALGVDEDEELLQVETEGDTDDVHLELNCENLEIADELDDLVEVRGRIRRR